MKSVALHNLGCKVNAYEMDAMGQMLQESGYKIVPFDEKADIYLVNTCTVTGIADQKSRQMLHRAKKNNPEAVVVAVGCYVQTGREAVEQDPCIDLAIGNNRKKDLIPILEAFLAGRQQGPDKTLGGSTVLRREAMTGYERLRLHRTGGHTRAYIKIQDGCDQFCSYCIIPYARGPVRSRRPEDVLEEVRGLSESGYQEIVLTGIHISSYGTDWERDGAGGYDNAREAAREKGHLLSLLDALQEVDGIRRIRLGSLEPRILTEPFVRALAQMPKLCPHFHLSLQSGCDETLRRMNRRYTTDEYYEKVRLLRGCFDRPAITTDVIAGFPQESEEEFAATRAFLERTRFYEMHVFKYSRRKGTAAASLPGQVPGAVKARRSAELMELERLHSRQYREAFVGEVCRVLLETPAQIGGKRYMTGYTERYVRVAVETAEPLSGRMVTCRTSGFLTDGILLAEEEGESIH